MDVAKVAEATHDAAKTANIALDSRQAGRQIHEQVANQLDGRLKSLDSSFMTGANRASGPQPDLVGINIWGDITTSRPGEWERHVRRYADDFGLGIPILYERGRGVTNSFRIYSGAGVGLSLIK